MCETHGLPCYDEAWFIKNTQNNNEGDEEKKKARAKEAEEKKQVCARERACITAGVFCGHQAHTARHFHPKPWQTTATHTSPHHTPLRTASHHTTPHHATPSHTTPQYSIPTQVWQQAHERG